MAVLTINFRSKVLRKDVPVNVILPLRYTEAGDIRRDSMPVLYLLHGLGENYSSWLRFSSIERYVRHKNLAVVMPDGDRVFYTDTTDGRNYFEYVTDELTKTSEALFNVSSERAHRYVAGLSMGGYGALKCALTAPYRYSACASLSGAVDIYRVFYDKEEHGQVSVALGDHVKDEQDIKILAEKAGDNMPAIYQACAEEDFLYNDNIEMRAFLTPICPDYTFAAGHGNHNWDYWDMHIKAVIDWLSVRDPLIDNI